MMTPLETVKIFFEDRPETQYKKGEILIPAGTNPETMFYIESGYVLQYAKTPGKDPINIHIYKPGSCFPLMWLFNNTPNRYNYQAVTNVSIKTASEKQMKLFLIKHTDVLEYFTSRLLLGLDGLLARMESLVLDDAYQKTVLLFLYLAKAFGEKNSSSVQIMIPISHFDVAAWIGTARETASIQVEKLMKKGIISQKHKRYEIVDLAALDKEVDSLKV